MVAPPKVVELVNKFEQYKNHYLSPSYNEAQLRIEFLNPFFEELGWDVYNNKNKHELYKEVIHEDAVRVEGKSKAPDYSFRVGGFRKFFVEAKKPAVNLKDNPEPAYQLRRYAWSAKLPISILTDFEEFSIYDCTAKPSKNDKAAKHRIGYFSYKDYIDKWDEIAGLFSLNAIYQGKLDEYADTLRKKKGGKGTADIDDAFLAEIEDWRDKLAKNIALRNKDLTVRELNLAVQKIIDRIVFLRICEDRGVEKYEQLKKKAEGKDVYKNLIDLFLYADDKYNSGLFHFRKEEGMDEPDILTTTLDIDDKILKDIIGRLYYPESPYEFSVLPSDILGQVYEQFLGKVIRLTASHQAKIEEKPEVKKAGGVYYTPTYIVDYIVKKTVGKLVEDKTPKDVSEIKILDPACGSGSFLIGAYKYLLDWHIGWYIHNLVPLLNNGKTISDEDVKRRLPVKPVIQKKGRKKNNGSDYQLPVYQMSDTDWRLTTDEKKRILLNNIYGVDIDQQAVEVTKLSLLLKVLEGEKSERISKQLTITQERVLPSLHNNIKCGNSLIGPDIYSDVQTTLFEDEEYYRINPFDWNTEFSSILGGGGFDAVIGNPPYVRQELLKEQKDYFKDHYEVYQGTTDLYAYFIEKGISLLRTHGIFSYIVSNKWMRANYGKPLREWLKKQKIEEIVDFGDLPVFKKASTYPCILRVSKGKPDDTFDAVEVENLEFRDLSEYVRENKYPISQNSLDASGWSLVDEKSQALLNKLWGRGVPLGEYVEGKIFYGIKTGLNKAFVIDEEIKERLISKDPKSTEFIKPFLAGRDIKRYKESKPDKYLILFERGWTNKNSEGHNNKWKWLKDKYPAIAEHLEKYSVEGEKRYDKGDYWWELRACDYYQEFEKPKMMLPDISIKSNFTIDEKGELFCVNTAYIIGNCDYYLLGILNSKLMTFYYSLISPVFRGGFLRFIYQYLVLLPICKIDFSDPSEKAMHDKMVSLVEQMLDLNKKLDQAKLESDKEMIKRRIEATDNQIDKLVYELYGLTDEEIAIVEGK